MKEARSHLQAGAFAKALDCALVATKLDPYRWCSTFKPACFNLPCSTSFAEMYHNAARLSLKFSLRVPSRPQCWAVMAEAQMSLGHYRAALSASR